MADKPTRKRLVVCIDGHEVDEHGRNGYPNDSTVHRISRIIDTSSQPVSQSVKYYRAVGDGASFSDKLKSRYSAANVEQQIKQITQSTCSALTSAHDELFFFGSGRGAYIARAVAGVMHHMGLPHRSSMKHFDEIYQQTMDLLKYRYLEDTRQGTKCLEYLNAKCSQPARVQFMGLFDTVTYNAEQNKHDLTFLPSVLNLRHALALNETRAAFSPDYYTTPTLDETQGRSFVQAWFAGTHNDLVGGTQHDGLSLYPFQWMVLEAILSGLVVAADPNEPLKTSPLALAFPQFAGNAPSLDSGERIEWLFNYSNDLPVRMFDLASLHGPAVSENESVTHSIRINHQGSFYSAPRKVFDSKKHLGGWRDEGPFGTIIHPSVYCILDRYPRLYDQYRFKALKEEFATFQENHMRDSDAPIPPWLQDMQLQASGVKAFRILVCGKTGVGKSTLINKVFGVEMTEESDSYAQGVHDINQAFESVNHPGLLIHDSRGWQAGSDKELDLIAKFLRHRAFQKDPAQALHVIWFCVDSDVSRIEEADKRTFETIAQFSHHVPVFVVGTKKDKLIAYRKLELLEKYMESAGNFQEASKLAAETADKLAEEQFESLREQLSKIPHYKADGYSCISRDDDIGVKHLLNQTLELITDDRVRLFCVAAQVVDVEQKIDSAITECMRLGTHAIRTAMVPLPCSGLIGTPTVSRIICEHVLQCFGFPKAKPAEVHDIMSRVVLKNLKSFLTVSLTHFFVMGGAAVGLAMGTAGVGLMLGAAGSIISGPPTARMLFQCACDMILILERSFRYKGKYVSVKQIEDAAIYYTTATTKTFSGKATLLQEHVHEEVDRLIPLKKISIGMRFQRLRSGLEEIIHKNRFQKSKPLSDPLSRNQSLRELPGSSRLPTELDTPPPPHNAELDAEAPPPHSAELPGDLPPMPTTQPLDSGMLFDEKKGLRTEFGSDSTTDSTNYASSTVVTDDRSSNGQAMVDLDTPTDDTCCMSPGNGFKPLSREKTEGSILSRGWKGRSLTSRFSLKKTKTQM
ncbi:hypothetical protein DV737_g3360, partial [Chaetothyriales sp. CBS 132003]